MIYTVTFNPSLDYVIGVDSFSIGKINRTTYESISYGGKGINVSCVLNTLGVKSIALGFVAGFSGQEITRRVCSEGIETRFIEVNEGMSRINIKLKGEKETEINGQGPIITPLSLNLLFDQLDTLVEGDILVLAGSIQTNLPNDIYQQIMARLFGKGILFVVDATKDLLMNVLPYRPFLIKPNHHELGDLFGVNLTTEDEIVHYARKLQQLGACNVLVSMAGDGSLLVDEHGNCLRMGVANGTVKNSVGAGDSMLAGFLAGYLTTSDYAFALKLGTSAGSATAFSIGLGSRKRIDSLLLELDDPHII